MFHNLNFLVILSKTLIFSAMKRQSDFLMQFCFYGCFGLHQFNLQHLENFERVTINFDREVRITLLISLQG